MLSSLFFLAAIECPPLLSIANGFITYAPNDTRNYALGTVATYSCNTGFVLDLSVGSRTRTCTDNDNVMDAIGEFDGQTPTCIGELIVPDHMHPPHCCSKYITAEKKIIHSSLSPALP